VADDEIHPVAEEVVGHRNALAGIARVVADEQLDLLAVDAPCRVDVRDGLFRAIFELCAESGVGARHRTGDANLELFRSAVTAGEEGGECERQCGEGGC